MPNEIAPPAGAALVAGLPRTFRARGLQVRAADSDGDAHLSGHAAVFDTLSLPFTDWWGDEWYERIERGSFAETLAAGDIDVVATFNHNLSAPLGRRSNGRLELREDDDGLWFDVQPVDTSYSRDLLANVAAGNVTQCSFMFDITRDRWEYDHVAKRTLHIVTGVRLYELGPVTFGQYPTTDVGLRSAEVLARALTRLRAGETLCDQERAVCERVSQQLTSLPRPPAHVDPPAPDPAIDLHRRRLALAMRR